MISRRSGEALLVIVLVLSLFFKISGRTNAETQAPTTATDRVATFLERSGFDVVQNAADVDLFSLSATKGQCHLFVGVLSPHGWHRHVIRQIVPADRDVRFFIDGTLYADQPVLRTRFDHYWGRLLRYVGFDRPERPVLGIAGTPECGLDDMPAWRNFTAALRHLLWG
jgi:hypothetical protein